MVEAFTPEEVSARLRTDPSSVFLLDVREADEREAARIEPSVHIPMNQVPDRTEEIPRDRTVVVYCHHGHRSAMVASFLEQMGFEDVANLEGGIDAWSARVDARVARY